MSGGLEVWEKFKTIWGGKKSRSVTANEGVTDLHRHMEDDQREEVGINKMFYLCLNDEKITSVHRIGKNKNPNKTRGLLLAVFEKAFNGKE